MHQPAAIADLRSLLLSQGLALLGQAPEDVVLRFTERARGLLESASDQEVAIMVRRILDEDVPWGYHPPCPLARSLHHAIGEVLLSPDSRVEGAEHLAAVQDRTLLLLPNHISYSDANLIEVLLDRAGFAGVAQRLTVIAGPKVYSDPLRRFSSLCFGTIKVAQSASRATEEATMRPRDVARYAREAISVAFHRLDQGDALLIFGEGTRSRSGQLQTMLPAVARYCERPDLWLVPVGITGSEDMMGLGDRHLQSTRVVVHIGRPIEAQALRADCGRMRAKVAEAIGRAIAGALPEAYRGVYAAPAAMGTGMGTDSLVDQEPSLS